MSFEASPVGVEGVEFRKCCASSDALSGSVANFLEAGRVPFVACFGYRLDYPKCEWYTFEELAGS